MRFVLASAMAVLISASLIACGGDDDTAVGTDTTTETSTTTQTTTPDEELIGVAGTETRETSGFPTASREGGVALLTDVRVAGHEGFDRVTFEFREGDVPGYRVEYREPPINEDASGEEVEVAGDAFLAVAMTPASGVDLSGEDFEEIYTGPDRLSPSDTDAITEVVNTGDFEAVLSWVVGLEAEASFAVGTLSDPPRLVIDIVTS